MVKSARAISPTHVSGFFEIKDESPDLLRKGSRGAGICLALYVETTVQTSDRARGIEVFINGGRGRGGVSLAVGLELTRLSKNPTGLIISHRIPVPIGGGFATSAAGALGTALAGGEALNLGLTGLEAAQLAHNVEVDLHTGLGSVIDEFYGGLNVRSVEGGPGFGRVIRIPTARDLRIVALYHAPISTQSILLNPELRARINSVGRSCCDRMIEKRDLRTFLNLSHYFAVELGLAKDELKELMNAAALEGYTVGMAMLGQTLFTVVRENEVAEVQRLLKSGGIGEIITAPVSERGATIV